MSDKEKITQLIADSRLAFLNQQNDVALRLAKEAIALDASNANAYQCAANSYMSLGKYDEAIKNYTMALKHDANNGNRYFELGFAYATNGNFTDAIKNLAKADELGCDENNRARLYNLLGIICFEIRRFDDALINFSKAEQLLGVDTDILQRKAIIYGIKNDIRKGVQVANELKLVAPSDYLGYKLAFKFLVQAKQLNAAKKELERAKRYAKLNKEYYDDCVTYELELYNVDGDKTHFGNALVCIEKALEVLQPTARNVVESYINAAEIYLQLENADRTIACLNAAQNPVGAYNNGFDIVIKDDDQPELTVYDIDEMAEKDRELIESKFGNDELMEMLDNSEPDEDGRREFLTDFEEEEPQAPQRKKLDALDENDDFTEFSDQMNQLYAGAYTVKKDYEKVMEYAQKLQASKNTYNIYVGKYTEVNAMKELGLEQAAQKYQELIKYFRNAMIKDPTDVMVVSLRVQCHIDIGEYDEAEEVCSLLVSEVKEPLLKKIKEARTGGE